MHGEMEAVHKEPEFQQEAWRKLWKETNTPRHYREHVHKLADQGHYVVGVEMVEEPVKVMFGRDHLDVVVEESDTGRIYKTADGRMKVYVSDLFSLTREDLGLFDIIWDRAAFVALSKDDRQRYVNLLKSVMTDGCRLLLAAVDMKKASGEPTSGPPLVTRAEDLQELFGSQYAVSFLEKLDCTHQADPFWEVEFFHENLYLIQMRKSD